MPLVDITWYEGRTAEQKDRLARAICEAFVEFGDAGEDTIHVIFRDIDRSQWIRSAELFEQED